MLENAGGGRGGAVRWRVTDDGRRAVVTVSIHRRMTDAPHPHLSAVVLDRPFDGEPMDGWTATDEIRGSLDDGSEITVVAPFLVPATIRNLQEEESSSAVLPVPGERVVGVLIGSLTNRLWVETPGDRAWIINSGDGPRLDDGLTRMGTDPLVRRHRLVITGEDIRLEPIETVLLSALHARTARNSS